MLSLIVARSKNHAIGKENKLLWNLPTDMAWFKEKTKGKPIIMGRKTYESIGSKPLPNRMNVVVTSNRISGTYFASSLENALLTVKDVLDEQVPEIMLIGGSQLYHYALSKGLIDRIYLTEVDTEINGDSFFEFDEDNWQVLFEKPFEDNLNGRFLILERK